MLEAAKAYAFVRHGGAHRDRDYRPVMSAFTVMLLVVLFSVLAPSVAHGIHATGDLDCDQCHKPHVPAVGTGLLDVDDPSVENATDVCMFCHDSINTGGSTIKVEGEFGLTSGHVVESDTTPDLTNECSGCHSPHTDTTGLPRPELNGYTVDTATHPNTWCRACHDPDSDPTPGDLTKPDSNWSGVTGTDYYDQMFTSRLPDTYIGSGTFRGWTAYDASAHGLLTPATADLAAGDCLWCHERHSSTSTYDNLKGDFGPSTPTDINADACFASGCHDDYATMGYGSGHFITDAADASPMDPDAPLPCYECHNAHGSKNGNTKLIQDSLGAGLDPSTKAGESAFCYTCHLSSDGYGWNSTTTGMELWTTLASESGITTSVAGIPREDMLVLPPTVPQHAHDNLAGCACHGSVHAPDPEGVSNGGQTCYDCHSGLESSMEYSSASGVYGHIVGKVGRPGDTAAYPDYGTDTKDKIYCLSCHVDHTFNADRGKNLRTHVADGGGAGVAQRTDFVYSADGNSANDGICLSCHSAAIPSTDTDYAVSGPNYTGKAHDYVVSDPTIIGYDDTSAFEPNCTKCHTDPEGLDGPRQDGPDWQIAPHFSSDENRIAQALGATVVATTSDSTEENLCFACHDGDTADGKDGYGVIPYALDGTQSRWGDVKDQFTTLGYTHGVDDAAMAGEHSSTETGFDSTNKHIECEDCHNAHAAGATLHVAGGSASTTPGSANGNMINTDSPLLGVWGVDVNDPPNPPTGWSTLWTEPSIDTVLNPATHEYQICFKCHSSYNTAYSPGATPVGANATFSWGGAGADAWTNVALEFNPNNRSYHPVVAPLGATKKLLGDWMDGDWATAVGTQTMTCSDCHGAMASTATAAGPHGSSIPHILKGYWPIYPGADGVLGTADDDGYSIAGLSSGQTGLLCDQCHNGITNQRAHSQGGTNHKNARCYNCHIVVPHGGALSRLIGDGNSSMPARYAYQGNKANMFVSQYTWNSAAIARNDCSVTSSSGCGTHNQNTTGKQNW